MFADADDEGTQVLSRSQLGRDPSQEPLPPDRGVRAITIYKFVRAGLALLLALLLVATVALGHAAALARFATQIRSHCSSAFSVALAEKLLQASAPRRLWLVALALTVDGLITGCEGWALRTGKRWGEWLVVVVTGAFVPFELVALWRSPHVGRLLLLLANVLVAAYLIRAALRQNSHV
jgi:uncharacterized membrane protein (DUF2068 family)